MLKRYIPFVIAAIVAVFAGIYQSQPASAAVNYFYDIDRMNVYNTETITYDFTGLDSTTTYTWGVYTADIVSGGINTLLGTFTSTPDDRTGDPTIEEWIFGGSVDAPVGPSLGSTIEFPVNYVGPIIAVDMTGTFLGRHFIADFPGGDWNVDGNTLAIDKQAIGPTRFAGPCQAPVYADLNSDGWQHSFNPCSVTTTVGQWAILHYQVGAAYDPTMDDTDIIFYQVPTSTEVLRFSLNELLDFQYPTSYTMANHAEFIVVNTGGTQLPFIDNGRCNTIFLTNDNPCRSQVDRGVYNYSRRDVSSVWVSDGESVWIVTGDPTLREWGIESQEEVGDSGRQIVTITAVTSQVWDSYHGSQVLEDSLQGTIDSTVYAFSTSRQYPYTVSGTPGSAIVTWTVAASALNSGLATPAEMAFVLSDFYEIIEVDFPTFEENLNQVLDNTGLNTDAGRAALLTMILFVGMLGTAAFSALRANIYAYLVVWTGLGAVYILGGFSTGLITAVFSVFTIAMWVFALVMINEDWGNHAEN